MPSSEQQQQQQQKTEDRGGGGGAPVQMQNATTSIEELSNRFTGLLLGTSEHETPTSVEGLAYASVQPKVKESLARNAELLKKLVKVLSDAPPKSSLTFGCLSIFVNLTRYLPALSEEDKQIAQLRAYANASGGAGDPDPLSDNAHVTERCRLVFEAGIVPVLVTRSKDGSPASLGLVVAIVHAIAATQSLRGRLAQQGAVRMLLAAWSALASVAEESAQSTPGSTLKLPSPNHPTPLLPTPPGSDGSVAAAQHTRRLAAHALARILVSTDPSLVFGGDGLRAAAADRAVRPLASLLQEPDSTSSAFTSRTRDLLPTFEALLALTNLASGDQKDADDGSGIANTITQLAFPATEELLLSSNVLVARAAAELVCNLARSPPVARLYGADDSITASEKGRARNRLHVLVALAGSTDARTRSAAGGALAFLTAYPSIVEAVLALERGVTIILALCTEDDEKKAVSVEWEDLAHRGAAILGNMMTQEGSVGAAARKRVRELRGVETLTAVARQARRAEVVEVVVGALKALVEGD